MKTIPKLKLLILATIFVSCTTKKNLQIKPKVEDAPKFLYFVSMEIKKDRLSNSTISSVQTIKLQPTSLKEPLQVVNSGNYLSMKALMNGKLLDSQSVQHPLYQQLELIETTTLESKNVTLDRAEVFVRIVLPEGQKEIHVSETINGKPTPFFFSIIIEN